MSLSIVLCDWLMSGCFLSSLMGLPLLWESLGLFFGGAGLSLCLRALSEDPGGVSLMCAYVLHLFPSSTLGTCACGVQS